jgi:hypothetical protein
MRTHARTHMNTDKRRTGSHVGCAARPAEASACVPRTRLPRSEPLESYQRHDHDRCTGGKCRGLLRLYPSSDAIDSDYSRTPAGDNGCG